MSRSNVIAVFDLTVTRPSAGEEMTTAGDRPYIYKKHERRSDNYQ